MSAAVEMRKLLSAIALAACAAIPNTVRAQQPTSVAASRPVPHKDPQVATILGVLIPGAGQFYAGRYGKAAAVFAGTLLPAGIAVDAHNNHCDAGPCTPNRSVQTVAIGTAVLVWGYGWVTAGHDARLHNDQRLNTTFAPFLDRHDGRVLAGLTLATR